MTREGDDFSSVVSDWTTGITTGLRRRFAHARVEADVPAAGKEQRHITAEVNERQLLAVRAGHRIAVDEQECHAEVDDETEGSDPREQSDDQHRRAKRLGQHGERQAGVRTDAERIGELVAICA